MKSPRSNGSGSEIPDSEEWGFNSRRSGMSTPGKIGLMFVLLLVGAFAFVAYRRLHKQDDLVTQIKGMIESEEDVEANPADSQSPPPRTDNQTSDGTQTASTPDGSYRSQTAGSKVDSSGLSSGSRSALGESSANSTVASGSGSREPRGYSGLASHAPAADPSSFPPASDAQTTEFTTTAAGSQPDPFAKSRASSGDTGTADGGGNGGSNPFAPQSEPNTATVATATSPAPVSEHSSGTTDPSTRDNRSSSTDAGPGPFGSQIAARTSTRETSAEPGLTGVAKDTFTNSSNLSNGSPQGTTTRTGGTGTGGTSTTRSQPGSDRGGLAAFDPQSTVGPVGPGGAATPTSAGSSTASGTAQTHPGTSAAPWQGHTVGKRGAPTKGVDPGGVESLSSSTGKQGAREPTGSASPQSSGSASSGSASSGSAFGEEPGQTRSDQPQPIAYVVRRGDNYWRISKRLYGTGRYFTALARYNKSRIPDSRRMRPGMQILVPSHAVLETRFPDLHLKSRGGRVGNAKTPRQQLSSGFFRDANGDPMYRVGARDTLTGISLRCLGRSSRWIQIRELNRDRLSSAANLKIGTVLRLPADASQVQLVREPRDIR